VKRVIGFVRLQRLRGTKRAKLVLVVDDLYQKSDLARRLLQALFFTGKQEGIEEIFAYILKEDTLMLQLCRDLDFKLEPFEEHPTLVIARRFE